MLSDVHTQRMMNAPLAISFSFNIQKAAGRSPSMAFNGIGAVKPAVCPRRATVDDSSRDQPQNPLNLQSAHLT